uniref:(northern house mosquito) hypothetical protein n=1 Tax=Culex pipiens TaxID=7175 RepID=A0A8D8PI65_CULPI
MMCGGWQDGGPPMGLTAADVGLFWCTPRLFLKYSFGNVGRWRFSGNFLPGIVSIGGGIGLCSSLCTIMWLLLAAFAAAAAAAVTTLCFVDSKLLPFIILLQFCLMMFE